MKTMRLLDTIMKINRIYIESIYTTEMVWFFSETNRKKNKNNNNEKQR